PLQRGKVGHLEQRQDGRLPGRLRLPHLGSRAVRRNTRRLNESYGRAGVLALCGQSVSTAASARAAPVWNALRRLISATGIEAVSVGAAISHKVPVRSSSSRLLSGRIARPKPASAIRFCAVRLSIGRISAPPSPWAASSCASAIAYRSAGAPGG